MYDSRLSPRAPGRGDDEHGLDGLRLHLVVMRLDRVNDPVRLAVALGVARGDERVRALLLVRQRLAEVVEHRGTFRRLDAGAELAGHDPGQVNDLERVLEHVLAVAGAELE